MTQGAAYLLRGFGMWRRRPGLMLLGMVPAAIVFAVLGGLVVVLLLNLGDLTGWLTPFADGWGDAARALLRTGVAVVLVVATLALAAMSFTGLTLMVGDPFYERIWRETEAMLGGPVPTGDLGLGRAVRDGAVMILIGAATSVVVVVIGFLPVVGAVAGVVLGFVVSGRLLGNELVARPLEARGLDREARRALCRPHQARVLGFGMATQVFFVVPLGAIVVMPAAVVGATMLGRDLVEHGSGSSPAHGLATGTHQHRAVAEVPQLVRGRAQHRALEWALAGGADGDHAGVMLVGDLGQRLGGLGVHQLDLSVDPGGVGTLHRVRKRVAADLQQGFVVCLELAPAFTGGPAP